MDLFPYLLFLLYHFRWWVSAHLQTDKKPPLCKGRWHGLPWWRDCKKSKSYAKTIPLSLRDSSLCTREPLSVTAYLTVIPLDKTVLKNTALICTEFSASATGIEFSVLDGLRSARLCRSPGATFTSERFDSCICKKQKARARYTCPCFLAPATGIEPVTNP